MQLLVKKKIEDQIFKNKSLEYVYVIKISLNSYFFKKKHFSKIIIFPITEVYLSDAVSMNSCTAEQYVIRH